MKVEWEASDIIVGRRVRKPGTSETWLIGYDPNETLAPVAIISLSDGMIAKRSLTYEGAAELLNANQSVPVELLGAA